jgi:hypothetical protein
MLPIHMAAERGNLEVSELLLDQQSEIDPLSTTGDTPLHLAASGGHLEVAKLLVERGAKLHAKNEGGWTPLYYAAMNGPLELVKLLRYPSWETHKDIFQRTPLHRAVTRGHSQVAEYLAKSQDPTMTDGYGYTALDWAANDASHLHFLAQRYPEHQQSSRDMGQIRRSVCELSKRLLKTKRRNTVVGFEELGHCMIYLNDLDGAVMSFQQQITNVDDDGKLEHDVRCFGCPWEYSPTRIWFVCTECPDINLCEDCVDASVRSEKRAICKTHTFLEIAQAPPTPGEDIPQDMQVWLEALVARYDVEKTADSPARPLPHREREI